MGCKLGGAVICAPGKGKQKSLENRDFWDELPEPAAMRRARFVPGYLND
jgi:hypothetical protein